MNDTIIIIPARAGSKTIPNKNLLILNKHPLIAYSIAIGKLMNHRVLVSTDSQEYADISIRYGAEVPFLRPKDISRDNSIDIEFITHAMNWVSKHETYNPEYWVHLRPTTPLRRQEDIEDAIKIMKENKIATSLRSAHISPESPYKWFKKKNEIYFSSFISDEIAFNESYNLPKEEFEKVYIPDGYVDILRSSHVLSSNNLHGDNILSYVSPENCTEVDSYAEFKYIEYMINLDKYPITEYLNSLL